MTAPSDRCHKPDKCGSLLGDKENCGYKALRGEKYCLRGETSDVIGLEMGPEWVSPFAGGGEE